MTNRKSFDPRGGKCESPVKIKITPKMWPAVLSDTARLLDDLAKLHPSPDYVRAYANDVRRVLKQLSREHEERKVAR